MIKVYSGDDADKFIDGLIGETLSADANTESERQALETSVKDIINIVRKGGDNGILEIAIKLGDLKTTEYDTASGIASDTNTRGSTTTATRVSAGSKNPFRLSQEAIDAAVSDTSEATRKTLELAASRIRNFGQAIVDGIKPVQVDCGEFQTGVDYRPVRRVACYVPAGRYPLPSTALMTAVTAQVAGVQEIVIVSPQLRKEIITAGTIAGVTEFYQIGGAQAVAAMAFGTDTIEAVDMIVGPGNAYVTEAKRQLQGTVGIDMLAGPSEICVIADDEADPEWLSLDLLSQAEHDPDARAYLLTTNEALAQKVAQLVAQNVVKLELPAFLRQSLASSAILVLNSIEDCCSVANQIAPEHLLLSVRAPEKLKEKLTNYGALFLGYGCTVAFGDYMAGPNHTLPTSRSARFQGCLSPLTFLRAQSWIKVATNAAGLATATADFASIEGLVAHAAAATARASQSELDVVHTSRE